MPLRLGIRGSARLLRTAAALIVRHIPMAIGGMPAKRKNASLARGGGDGWSWTALRNADHTVLVPGYFALMRRNGTTANHSGCVDEGTGMKLETGLWMLSARWRTDNKRRRAAPRRSPPLEQAGWPVLGLVILLVTTLAFGAWSHY